MAKDSFYIERRESDDYAVRREGSKRASVVTPTQKKAEEWLKERHPDARPRVERVRNTKAGTRDHWRKE